MQVEAIPPRPVEDDLRAHPSPPKVEPPGPSAKTPERPPTVALHILVVEDEEQNRVVLGRLLRHCGHHVTTAVDGREALAQIETLLFDLVLMDIQMPGLDGLETTRAIRFREQQSSPIVRVPIVAYTGLSPDRARPLCLAAGMDDLLSKPANLTDLIACIDRWRPAPPLPIPGPPPSPQNPA